jgi:hypothetical protein
MAVKRDFSNREWLVRPQRDEREKGCVGGVDRGRGIVAYSSKRAPDVLRRPFMDNS